MMHWNSTFGRISAKEFFAQVDVNNDNRISLEEFQEFWQAVKTAGNSEEEILEELINIRSGQSWVSFSNLPKKFKAKSNESIR